MGLSEDIKALGVALAPPEEGWADPAPFTALLDPRLRTTYSPRQSWGDWRGFGPAPAVEEPTEWARLWDPAEPEPLGSSLAPNPKRPARYGLSGMPSAARRQIWRALALLEEMKRSLSFWTVTLPDEAISELHRRGTLAAFQDRLRKELTRRLKVQGMCPLVLGVAELQPQRTRAQGRPAPHWHVVFLNKRQPHCDWVLTPADLDGVIDAALQTAGIRGANLASAGGVESIRKSVKAYLAKYMSKGSTDTERWIGHTYENLIPHQWWFWTMELRAWVLEHVLPVAFPFLAWVHARREQLQRLELLSWRVVPLADPAAPLTVEINWLSCGKLARLVALWHEDLEDERLLAQWEAGRLLREWAQGAPAGV